MRLLLVGVVILLQAIQIDGTFLNKRSKAKRHSQSKTSICHCGTAKIEVPDWDNVATATVTEFEYCSQDDPEFDEKARNNRCFVSFYVEDTSSSRLTVFYNKFDQLVQDLNGNPNKVGISSLSRFALGCDTGDYCNIDMDANQLQRNLINLDDRDYAAFITLTEKVREKYNKRKPAHKSAKKEKASKSSAASQTTTESDTSTNKKMSYRNVGFILLFCYLTIVIVGIVATFIVTTILSERGYRSQVAAGCNARRKEYDVLLEKLGKPPESGNQPPTTAPSTTAPSTTAPTTTASTATVPTSTI